MAEIEPPLRSEILVDVVGRPTLRFAEFLESLATTSSQASNLYGYSRSIPGESSTQSVQLLSAYMASQIPDQINYNAVTKTSDYTALSFDNVNGKNSITITFPEFPCINSSFITKNGDGSLIKLNGNGRNLNGDTTGRLSRKYTSIIWDYFIDTNEWLAR